MAQSELVPSSAYMAAYAAVGISRESAATARYRNAVDAAAPYILEKFTKGLVRSFEARAHRAAMAGNKREAMFLSSLVRDLKEEMERG